MGKDIIKNTANKIKEIGKIKLDSSITIRIDNNIKEEFEKICHDMGLSISSAISAFVTKVVNSQSIPFNLTTQKTKRKLGIANGKYNIDYNEFDKLDDEIIDMFGV